MTTATQQAKIPTWKEVIGNSLLIEFELKFDVNFSHRKQKFFIFFSHFYCSVFYGSFLITHFFFFGVCCWDNLCLALMVFIG
jgi:hypothetical protein